MSLKYEEVHVTPDLAEEWLESRGGNRHISKHVVDRYSRDMREGRWHTDGSPLKFDTHGRLRDGQHRLSAVVATGIARKFFVVTGVPDAAMTTMDVGKNRTVADVLTIFDKEIPNVNAVAATTVAHLRWSAGHRSTMLRNAPISNDAVLEHFQENKEALIWSTRKGKALAARFPAFTGQAFSLADMIICKIDEEDRDFFWEKLVEGTDLKPGDPIYALREYLIRESARPHNLRPRVRVEVALAFILKAWNAFRDGREMHLLKYTVGGRRPEAFPEPI